MFNRFKDDLKKYWKYAIYSSKAQLKSEIANSYLNWLWWILDPLCFMLIYVFMFGYVFKSKLQYFAIFIFIGITLWDFFNKSLLQSVKLIKSNKPIVSKVYIPKFILIFVKMGVNGFKMCISLLIVVAMMIVWRVPVTWNVLYFIPIMMTLVVIVFGFACFLLHYGVFGNVAARMNSINANRDTFRMYTDMFLTEYIILAIHLNSQGALSDVVLNKVKKNANLMI